MEFALGRSLTSSFPRQSTCIVIRKNPCGVPYPYSADRAINCGTLAETLSKLYQKQDKLHRRLIKSSVVSRRYGEGIFRAIAR